MKRIKLCVLVIGAVLWGLFDNAVYAGTQDFYFESGEFDYYLSQADSGSSTMQVKETLVAVFPDYDQNHGIERCLPVKNNGVQTLDVGSFVATRNDSLENVSYYWSGGQACFRIGNNDKYVHGKQIYVLQYTEDNVISGPESTVNQRLYWNINGIGWKQKFNQVVARVHLEGRTNELFDGSTECYVGLYGTSGEDTTSRCTASGLVDNTITFEASDVMPGETMTVLVNFLPDSFGIIEPEVDAPEPAEAVDSAQGLGTLDDSAQTPVNNGAIDSDTISLIICICIVAGVSIMILAFIVVYLYFLAKYRKRLPRVVEKTSPMEYAPPNMSVAEANLIYNYLGKPSNTAVILELALKDKISLGAVKEVRKKLFTGREDQTIKWNIRVKNMSGIKPYQYAVLMALNKNAIPKVGDVIEIKLQTEDVSDKAALLKSAAEDTVNILTEKKLLNKGAEQNDSYPMWIIACQVFSGVGLIFALASGATYIFSSVTHVSPGTAWAAWLLGAAGFGSILLLLFMLPHIYGKILEKRTLARFYTEKGIKTKLYLDGLRRYMKLAEAERIKFLQSVPGVDISDKGIVKLYEKLLPYAVVFGLESTWIMELEQYYQSTNTVGPDWGVDGAMIDYTDLGNLCTALGMYVGNSQGFEDTYTGGDFGGGGDGGGFSGGGGGGGGGGGW